MKLPLIVTSPVTVRLLLMLALPVTTKLSPTVTSELLCPSMIGIPSVLTPILTPFVVSLVSISIAPEPLPPSASMLIDAAPIVNAASESKVRALPPSIINAPAEAKVATSAA